MESCRFALVAYVKDPAGQFVEGLSRELNPGLPNMSAHLTILPPRVLQGSESKAVEIIEEVCAEVEPFAVTLADVETFIPVTPTLFIRVGYGAYRMRELHDKLQQDSLAGLEQWPYMPHLTIAKMTTQEEAQQAFGVARARWAQYDGSRTVSLTKLTFVRENQPNDWADLAGIPLGKSLVKS